MDYNFSFLVAWILNFLNIKRRQWEIGKKASPFPLSKHLDVLLDVIQNGKVQWQAGCDEQRENKDSSACTEAAWTPDIPYRPS